MAASVCGQVQDYCDVVFKDNIYICDMYQVPMNVIVSPSLHSWCTSLTVCSFTIEMLSGPPHTLVQRVG